MAKFCSKECEEQGSICDYCTHYKDEYRDILKLKKENEDFKFAGNGICDITKEEVFASDGFKCDNFECFRIKRMEKKINEARRLKNNIIRYKFSNDKRMGKTI